MSRVADRSKDRLVERLTHRNVDTQMIGKSVRLSA